MSQHIVVFGCGPMPCEPDGAVMAPGARTWQIARTASHVASGVPGSRLSIVCLESKTRDPFATRVGGMGATVFPMGIGDFTACETTFDKVALLGNHPVSAVIGCASIQPCATAVDTAARLKVPVWADVFGDPLSEVQSAAKPGRQLEDDHESALLHVWRLLTRTLLGADAFSALSGPQRLALIGQLGCAGRLNATTACRELVSVVPFGLWMEDAPPLTPLPPTWEFRVLWSGSFNTWTDPETLGHGVALALKTEPNLHLDVLGGAIAGYHEGGYARFQQSLIAHGAPMERISLLDWQPYKSLPDAYAKCHAALSLDRWTYEAVLGSRTRVVHMLFAGRPVISSALSELTSGMAKEGVLLPVEVGNPQSLADQLVTLARTDRTQLDLLSTRCRQVAEKYCSGQLAGTVMEKWLREPTFAADRTPTPTNALVPFWREALTHS